MLITVLPADYRDPGHARAIVALLDEYAADPAGGGAPLPDAVRASVVAELAKRPDAFSILAFADGRAAGLVNCFEGFSTFAARPLVNIHDMVVSAGFRGRGISRLMLAEVERIGRRRGCCKLTLEVLEGNGPAKATYAKLGFSDYRLDPAMGRALFWHKTLGPG